MDIQYLFPTLTIHGDSDFQKKLISNLEAPECCRHGHGHFRTWSQDQQNLHTNIGIDDILGTLFKADHVILI